MAITRLTTVIENALLAQRPGHTGGQAQAYSGLVSDVAVGDYLMGSRHEITAKSGTTTVTLTVRRVGVVSTLTYPSTATVQFLRPV
jgi:hypothetical protein